MKLRNLTEEETKNLFPENLIFTCYRGSIAHGMYDPNNICDIDVMGCFVLPKEHYIGLGGGKVTVERMYKEYDAVSYELQKLTHLLLKSNPNVLSALWVEDQHIILTTELWDKFRLNRDIFSSKQVYHSFSGYAKSQFSRMTGANKYEGYMGEKRRKLVDKFGFDTKNASHLLRLLHMGIEFLTEGILYVDRGSKGDASYFLDVRNGEYTLAQVTEEAKRLFALAEEAYVRSDLPNKPNRAKIESDLCEYLMDTIGE